MQQLLRKLLEITEKWRVRQILEEARLWIIRLWVLVGTTYRAYPDPLLQVQRRSQRLRVSHSIQPRKMTLVLDLDETLVHSSSKRLYNYDWKVYIPAGDHPGCTFYVAMRPHTAFFLKAVSRMYEVVVFTASLQHYANPVIDRIDPGGCIARRFFRSSCREEQGNFLKDLSAVRPDLSQVVIVDNSPIAYSLHVDNALPISTWFNDPTDDALLSILPILSGLVLLNDVRSILSLRTAQPRYFQFPEAVQFLGLRVGASDLGFSV